MRHVLFDGKTELNRYKVVEMIYEGRPSRVLFSGLQAAAQSGLALDGRPELLFEYNQRFMELALAINPRHVLLIGGGAYTFPTALLAALPEVRIDVVEIDEGLDEIAVRYFGLITDNPRLSIIHEDGSVYLDRCRKRYDLILLDAFTQTAIPRDLIGDRTVSSIHRHLKSHGILAMNIIAAYRGPNSNLLREVENRCSRHFKAVDIYPAEANVPLWLSQNLVLVAQKDTSGTLPLRYGPVGTSGL